MLLYNCFAKPHMTPVPGGNINCCNDCWYAHSSITAVTSNRRITSSATGGGFSVDTDRSQNFRYIELITLVSGMPLVCLTEYYKFYVAHVSAFSDSKLLQELYLRARIPSDGVVRFNKIVLVNIRSLEKQRRWSAAKLAIFGRIDKDYPLHICY